MNPTPADKQQQRDRAQREHRCLELQRRRAPSGSREFGGMTWIGVLRNKKGDDKETARDTYAFADAANSFG